MPLVVLCGLPVAGKTRVATALAEHLRRAHRRQVRLISDESVNVDKLRGYGDGRTEKTTRSTLKSAVEQALDTETVVVLDALNYIKGVRYELYCKARAESTTYCVIYVDTPLDVALERNAASSEPYDPEIIRGIASRFEIPSDKNRWDSPLFRLTPEGIERDGVPLEEIATAVIQGSVVRAGLATKAAPATETSFVQELDRVTSSVVDAIIAHQRDGLVADGLVISQSNTALRISRRLTTAEARRHRRQFVKIAQLRPSSTAAIGDMFVEYLNQQA